MEYITWSVHNYWALWCVAMVCCQSFSSIPFTGMVVVRLYRICIHRWGDDTGVDVQSGTNPGLPHPLCTNNGIKDKGKYNVNTHCLYYMRQPQLVIMSTGYTDHYNDVIMSAVASQITSLTIVYSINRWFRRRSKKTSKLRVTGLCAGNSPGTGEFPHKWPVSRQILPFDDVIMTKQHKNMPMTVLWGI